MAEKPRKARRAPAALLSLALLASVTACDASDQGADVTGGPRLTIAVTASSAEPRPALATRVIEQLKALGLASMDVGGASVAILRGGGPTLPAPAVVHDLTPLRGKSVERVPDRRVAKVDLAVRKLLDGLAAVRSSTPGLDLMDLLEQAGRLDPQDIVVVSSGVSTADPVDFRELGWSVHVSTVVQDLRHRGLLPRDLGGKSVTFVGLGEAAGTQPRLAAPEQRWVEQFWLGVCRAARARACRLGRGSATLRPPVATLPVPVVPVPTFDTRTGWKVPAGRCRVVLRLLSGLLFRADSAELRPGAQRVLRAVADQVRQGATVEEIAGHTADVGGADGQVLSERRAEAVKRELLDLGVPGARIIRTVGYGDRRPLQVDIRPDGTVDERLAARNRRVEVTIRDKGCPSSREEPR